MVETQTALTGNPLGTVSVLAWIGAPEEGHDTPYLLAYGLGDGAEGAAGSERALAGLADMLGLPRDGSLVDGTRPGFPVRLLVEGGQAVLSMPGLSVQCAAPPEWLEAVEESSAVHFMLGTKPWPEAVPGEPVTAEALRAYIGDETTLTSAGHCVLPVSQLRGS